MPFKGIDNRYTEQPDIDKRLWEWYRDYRESNARGNRDVYYYKAVSASRRVRRETVDQVGTPFLIATRAEPNEFFVATRARVHVHRPTRPRWSCNGLRVYTTAIYGLLMSSEKV